MTMHLFGTILTPQAVASNNRGESEGTVATLQKVIRNGDLYTTVSSEAVRCPLRHRCTGCSFHFSASDGKTKIGIAELNLRSQSKNCRNDRRCSESCVVVPIWKISDRITKTC